MESVGPIRAKAEQLGASAQAQAESAQEQGTTFIKGMTAKVSEQVTAAKQVSASAQAKAESAQVQGTTFIKGMTAKVTEHLTAAKQAAFKAAEPMTARLTRAMKTLVSTKVAVLEGAAQARATALAYAVMAQKAAYSVRADVKEKGIKAWAQETGALAKTYADEGFEITRTRAKKLAAQKSFQTTAASASAGAVAVGAAGGAAGLATGGALGAMAGLPFALFTFGLSIPVGAVLGGGTGLAVGATAGAATGAVGGGAAGYGVYAKKDDIKFVANSVLSKASDGVESVKARSVASVVYAKDLASAAKARLIRAGTGGTVESMD